MGCFIGEVAEKGDFIAEYVGEMINQVTKELFIFQYSSQTDNYPQN